MHPIDSVGEADGALAPDRRQKIAYVATRDVGYARNAIVSRALRSAFVVDTITSAASSYWVRIPVVAFRLLGAWLTGRLRSCDAVFVGFMAQPILPLVRLVWRGPLISDAYLSVYDTIVDDRRLARPGSLPARLARKLDESMLRHSDLVFTDTQAHGEYFRALLHPKGKLMRLWVSAEADLLGPWHPKDYRDGETFEVLFWGGFIPLQGVDVIVGAAGLLMGERVRFTLVGSGQTYAACASLCAEQGSTNVEFLGWRTLSEIGDLARRSHLALGIFGTSAKAGRVIPNKVFQALAMGMPVITRDSPAVRELLTDGDDVLTVRMGDPEALAERIRFARDHYAAAVTTAQRGQETFRANASCERVTRLLVAGVRECLDGAAADSERIAVGPR